MADRIVVKEAACAIAWATTVAVEELAVETFDKTSAVMAADFEGVKEIVKEAAVAEVIEVTIEPWAAA